MLSLTYTTILSHIHHYKLSYNMWKDYNSVCVCMSIVVYMQDYNTVCETKYEFCPRRPLISMRAFSYGCICVLVGALVCVHASILLWLCVCLWVCRLNQGGWGSWDVSDRIQGRAVIKGMLPCCRGPLQWTERELGTGRGALVAEGYHNSQAPWHAGGICGAVGAAGCLL